MLKISDISGVSLPQPPISREQLEALPSKIQALIVAVIDHYEQRLAELMAELAEFKKTPRNSSCRPAPSRAQRPAVIYRKLSFGTQSAAGSRFIKQMLTVSEICRLQSRSIFGYLTAALGVHFHHQCAPSLLPGT